MAELECGSYSVNGCVNNRNKSYIHVKLTDSAQKALENYIKYKSFQNSQLGITFSQNEGTLSIPNHSHSNVSSFKFQLQKAQESEGPQGSFESVHQIDSQLESLGPLTSVLRIQAKDDSYEKTRQSMANVMAQNEKICVKELKPQNGFTGRQRTRPMATVHKRDHVPASSFSSNSAPTSPHRFSSKKSSPYDSKRHQDNALSDTMKKKPLRDRIIHILALKPMTKIQVIQKLNSEGIKDVDKRHVASAIHSVSNMQDNLCHLVRSLWSQIEDDWPTYSDIEKQLVARNKRLKLHGHSTNRSPAAPPVKNGNSLSPPVKETLKRGREPETSVSKKCRVLFGSENLSKSTSKAAHNDDFLSDGDDSGEENSRNDSFKMPGVSKNDSLNLPGVSKNDSLNLPGVSKKDSLNLPGVSKNDCLNSPSVSRNDCLKLPGVSRNKNLVLDRKHSRSLSPLPSSSKFNSNLPKNGQSGESDGMSSPNSSPDSQQENLDIFYNYKEHYIPITSFDQRRQYKNDFIEIYKEYKLLHAELQKTKDYFVRLNEDLDQFDSESPEHKRIKHKFFTEYDNCKKQFNSRKRRFNQLDDVLKHIKQLVCDYDRRAILGNVT